MWKDRMAGRRQTPSARKAASSWAAWLNGALGRRGWKQSDLIRAAGRNADGTPVLSSSRVSQWVNGKQAASPEYAVIVARTLGEPAGDALRAIGEAAVASVAAPAAGEDEPDNRNAAVRQDDDDDEAFIAKLRRSTDPQMHKLADQFEADLERVRRISRVEYDELQRRRSEEQNDDTGMNTSVNKSA